MTFPPSVQSLLDTADDFDDMLQSIGFRKVFSIPERADPACHAQGIFWRQTMTPTPDEIHASNPLAAANSGEWDSLIFNTAIAGTVVETLRYLEALLDQMEEPYRDALVGVLNLALPEDAAAAETAHKALIRASLDSMEGCGVVSGYVGRAEAKCAMLNERMRDAAQTARSLFVARELMGSAAG